MPGWKPECFRGSTHEPEPVPYRPATEGADSRSRQKLDDDGRDIVIVELRKKEGCGLGLTMSGGVDKGIHPQVSGLRPGGTAYRSDALSVGDSIISVNGIHTIGMKHDEIVNLLKNAGEQIVLEVEYDLPNSVLDNSFSVHCKRHNIVLEKEANSFGFTVRGGYSTEQTKSRPLIITHIRPGSSADRDGSLTLGDRIMAVDDYNITHMSLSETVMFLHQCDQRASFSVEYDVSVMEAVQNASGPLLVEIDKMPGTGLGIKLSQSIYQGKRCVCVDTIRPMRIADRSGALHVGDHILSIDGASVEHMSMAEASQLLRSRSEDHVKLGILPIGVIRQQACREAMAKKALVPSIAPSLSSPALPIMPPPSNGTFGPLPGNNSMKTSTSVPFGSGIIGKSGQRTICQRPDRKQLSCMSLMSTATSVVTSNQVYRTETLELALQGDKKGLGITLEGGVFSTEVLGEPPVIACVLSRSAVERCGVIQEGDRLLSVNGNDFSERTLEEANQILRECRHQCVVEIEFDVAESVIASCGTFIVKLPKKSSGLGIAINAPANRTTRGNLVITEVRRGSVSHRCGSVQAGDHVLSINDVRTDALSIDDAYHLLQIPEDIIKIKLRRDDSKIDDSTDDCIRYTVELQRHGGPLGITISGTEDPVDPIIISDLISGGLAEKTGAMHVGDQLLAVNGTDTSDKTLSDTIILLQTAEDIVTLKIARPTETSKPKYNRKNQSIDKSTTPVSSIDSALESWDSSGPDYGASYNALSRSQTMVVAMPMRAYASSNKSEFGADRSVSSLYGAYRSQDVLEERSEGDENWEEAGSKSDDSCDNKEDWVKTFEAMDSQSEMLHQIGVSLRQRSTTSLDRRLRLSDCRQHCYWSHTSSRGAVSEDDLDNSYSAFMKSTPSLRTYGSGPHTSHEHFRTVFTPNPIQLHRITLAKANIEEDFGFGLSDGMYDKGVYVSAVRNGSLAEIAELKPFDRLLQINGLKCKDLGCGKVLPLINQADFWLELVVSRCPTKFESKADINNRYVNVQEARRSEQSSHCVNSTFHSDSSHKTVEAL